MSVKCVILQPLRNGHTDRLSPGTGTSLKHHHFETRTKLTTAALSIRNESNFRGGEAFRM